ncbi:Biotin--acetyl-CoA-carboxylase ligase [uncultured Desulfobacterium sp.]|uniref:Bifunctional ligase/repressor BirA n=1 Tax=uncultured Desulfobacterium sp. TaxID=201089 RepID=A0A445MU78_9BACT|nr:Biotin--acetyl-CoA-carboxylase ligase [uncultured Desulfobacterium sp.]
MLTKDQLLSYLKKRRGKWVSGELLSNEFSVSRAAIWKHVCKLRDDGCIIESSPKKGYLLNQDPDLIIPNEIRDGLSTSLFGQREIEYFKVLGSTNTKAKELAEGGAAEGSLIIAESQTDGRGRRGRSWLSPAGEGIYATLILRPAMSPAGAPKITLMTAVAVADAILSVAELDVQIKWPNDIMVKGRKLAGILTEISTEMDSINYIVVGLGLNVNNPDFPEELANQATSILIETGRSPSRLCLLKAYLEQFEKYYRMFIQGHFKEIMKRWKELSEIIGREIMIDVVGESHLGKVVDIDDDGVLILQNGKGEIHRIFSGDVTVVSS